MQCRSSPGSSWGRRLITGSCSVQISASVQSLLLAAHFLNQWQPSYFYISIGERMILCTKNSEKCIRKRHPDHIRKEQNEVVLVESTINTCYTHVESPEGSDSV